MRGEKEMSNKQQNMETEINLLILSDRLIDCAKELENYICSFSENINVLGIATNRLEVMQLAENMPVDYLIIAGYLKNIHSYDIVHELWEEKSCISVHWAMLDTLIIKLCSKYKIPLMFDRTLPIADFITYLKAHKNDKSMYTEEPLNSSTLKSEGCPKAGPEYHSKFIRFIYNNAKFFLHLKFRD